MVGGEGEGRLLYIAKYLVLHPCNNYHGKKGIVKGSQLKTMIIVVVCLLFFFVMYAPQLAALLYLVLVI